MNIDASLGSVFTRLYSGPSGPERYSAKSAQFSGGTEVAPYAVAEEQAIVASLRALFGKTETTPPTIGNHPDFLHLQGTNNVEHCAIATMFMDIESSTRLSVLYPLETVLRVKNAFIRSAILIIHAFDGHVHRIMGDAVMAYFGGRQCDDGNAVVDAINCAAVLRYFAQNVVIPHLKGNGVGHDFGIRIGVDYGGKEDVLWASYGYPGVEEVTATSFYVDVASKLQHSAGRNEAMLGKSILGAIDFPERLLSVKTVTRNGETVPEDFVKPNVTKSDGAPMNYRQRVLDGDEYLRCTPLVTAAPSFARSMYLPPLEVTCTVHPEKDSPIIERVYSPASCFIPKGKSLRFHIRLPNDPAAVSRLLTSVENHGREAKEAEELEHSTPIPLIEGCREYVKWESTAYRGLHYWTVDYSEYGNRKQSTRFGVYVE